MNENSNHELRNDLFISVIIGVTVFIVGYFKFIQIASDVEVNLFITIFITMLGFLATILTLLFTFKELFEKNTVIMHLESKGLYNQLYTEFIKSVLSLFYITVILAIISLINIDNLLSIVNVDDIILNLVLSSIIYSFAAFGFMKIYRPLTLFNELVKAIILYKKEHKN